MDDRIIHFCEACQAARLGPPSSNLHCPKCGALMENSQMRETANVPTLTFLGVMLLAGWLGAALEIGWLKLAGFGVPIGYVAAGFFIKSNLRWIFTRWVAEREPRWFSRKLMEDWRNSFWSGLLMENIPGMVLFVALVGVGISNSRSEAAKPAADPGRAQVAALGDLFRDTKNGYFTILPPKGWSREDYDDARTKVAWRLPADARVNLSVIVRRASEDITKVRRDAKSTSAGYRDRGFDVAEFEGEVAGVPAVVTTIERAGFVKARIWLFVSASLHLNVMFSAPTATLFEQHLASAERSLNTILPLPQKGGTAEQRQAEDLSWYRRLSLLYSKQGDAEASRSLAAEGLAKYPADPELKTLAGR